MSIAVFDIDGVVADVRHRLHHLQRRPKDWDAFFRAAQHDEILPDGVAMVHELAQEHDIVWLTGRPAWIRPVTRTWLAAAGLPTAELNMRGNSDRRAARLYKLAVLRSLSARTIATFVDDDTEVVDAALGAGLPAVLATWLPRTDTLSNAQEREGRT